MNEPVMQTPKALLRLTAPRQAIGRLGVCLGIVFAGIACIVFWYPQSPDAITANLRPVGEIQTNGEHWVLFRFDAPKSRAVKIHHILAIGGGSDSPMSTRAESFPDPKHSVHERIRAGGSRLLKVRRVAGGDWQLRTYFVVPFGLGKQCLERTRAAWREKSFKPWTRTYIERVQWFVESDFVKTIETVVAPAPPPVSPTWPEIFPPDFLASPFPTDEGPSVSYAR